jgi:hypothetical protein
MSGQVRRNLRTRLPREGTIRSATPFPNPMPARRLPSSRIGPLLLAAAVLAGCASRSANVQPVPVDASAFAGWSCDRIHDEMDAVQQRAADLAWTVDERSGNNIIALGVGLTIFWPAVLAMRPDGPEARDLAALKGRYEALQQASRQQACPPPGLQMAAERAAAWPVQVGERLVYEERVGNRGALKEWSLRLVALRRDEAEFQAEFPPRLESGSLRRPEPWKQDLAGNVTLAPEGALQWSRLLRRDLQLGQVVAGEIVEAGDSLVRARVRGQVVAVGPQTVAGRRFDAAVLELFGDVQNGETSTRLEGVLVVDRPSGVLLRLDLRSAQSGFNLQRRLARVEPAPAPAR